MSKKSKELVIPNFTAEDFLKTDEPYKWLYKYFDNKFQLIQLRDELKIIAEQKGVKNFITRWNAYRDEEIKKKGGKLDNATKFDNQELELFSGQYICDDDGVSTSDKYGHDVIVCQHPIMPVERLVNIDTGEERLKIAFKKGRYWRTAIVEKSVLASSNAILQLSSKGVFVNSENAKQLSTYLFEIEQLNYDSIPENNSVSRLGWVGDNDFAPYFDDLIFDGENEFKHIFEAVKPHGEFDIWLDEIKKLRAEKTVARIALAASFASVILKPCGLLPFFVHFWGGQGSGKTAGCLMLASSVWGNPQIGEYSISFNSTDVGQELNAAFLNNLPLCIDELQIQASSGVRDFDKMIYKLAEGIGKTRGTKTGGLRKQNTWRNCMITTGEYPIINSNSMGGANARVIEVECTDKVYSDLLGLLEVIKNNYGYAGKEFVRWLQKAGNIDRIVEIQKDYYRQLLNFDNTEKQAASASAILAADFAVTEFLFKDGNNLTVDDFKKILTKKDDVDANKRAYEYLFGLIARNHNHFTANDFGQYQGEVWGKKENNYIYIIKSVFDREISLAGFNPTSFLAWMQRKDFVEKSGRANTKIARICGTPTRCVVVKNDETMYEDLCNIDNFDDIEL